MTPELARLALVFLARVDIKGAEAPALVQLAETLDKIANPPRSIPDVSDQ